MWVMRPADAVEAAECWALALARQNGPVSLVFARQALPRVRPAQSPDNLSARGAYVLHEAACGPRQLTLLATGSEVLLAVQAREQLEAEGVGTAVVSMPCWELFDAQDTAYRRSVLGTGVRVGIEAAVRQGWDAYLGPEGGFVGMSGFGASGPADELYKLFNITPEAVVAEAPTRQAQNAHKKGHPQVAFWRWAVALSEVVQALAQDAGGAALAQLEHIGRGLFAAAVQRRLQVGHQARVGLGHVPQALVGAALGHAGRPGVQRTHGAAGGHAAKTTQQRNGQHGHAPQGQPGGDFVALGPGLHQVVGQDHQGRHSGGQQHAGERARGGLFLGGGQAASGRSGGVHASFPFSQRCWTDLAITTP